MFALVVGHRDSVVEIAGVNTLASTVGPRNSGRFSPAPQLEQQDLDCGAFFAPAGPQQSWLEGSPGFATAPCAVAE